MKLLSEKKKLYFLLLEVIFSFITIIIAAAFVNRADTNFLARNIPFQATGFILITVIYFIVATINKGLKLAAIFKIFKTLISLVVSIIIVYFPEMLIMNPTIITVLEFIIPILEIPFAYFFCKGFYNLVSQKTNNIVLANKWKKLLTANVILAMLNFISHIINLLDISSLPPVLLFAIVTAIYSLYIEILKVIYIIKTTKELA
ncbi:MAG: hypothetical protein J6A78_03690 [Clostridia bacterium]|nr:hypothetical protein [Clostridia bacterium]